MTEPQYLEILAGCLHLNAEQLLTRGGPRRRYLALKRQAQSQAKRAAAKSCRDFSVRPLTSAEVSQAIASDAQHPSRLLARLVQPLAPWRDAAPVRRQPAHPERSPDAALAEHLSACLDETAELHQALHHLQSTG